MTKRKMAYVILDQNCVCIAVYDDRTKAIRFLEKNGILQDPEYSDTERWVGRATEDGCFWNAGDYVCIEILPINRVRDYRA